MSSVPKYGPIDYIKTRLTSVFNNNITNQSYSTAIDPKNIKVVMIGECAVGKSSVVARLVFDKFILDSTSTVGGAFSALIIEHNNSKYKFQIWDTAGQEKYRSLVPMYVKKSNIVFLVFDITNYNTFSQIKNYWHSYVTDLEPNTMTVLIGNKADLEKTRQVKHKEVYEYANSIGIPYIECSAKNNMGISELIKAMLLISEQINREDEMKHKIYSEKHPEKYNYYVDHDINNDTYGSVILLSNPHNDQPKCYDGVCSD